MKYSNSKKNNSYVLTRDEIRKICDEITKTYPAVPADNLEKLVTNALNSVQYSCSDVTSFDKECIKSDILYALVNAAAEYDPSKGSFEAHFRISASRAKQNFFNTFKYPYEVRHEFDDGRRAMAAFFAKNPLATNKECARALGMTEAMVCTLQAGGKGISMDTEDEDGNSLDEVIPDTTGSESSFYNRCLKMVKSVYPKDSVIFEAFLNNNKKLGYGDVAMQFGLSSSDVKKAVDRCTAYLKAQCDSSDAVRCD